MQQINTTQTDRGAGAAVEAMDTGCVELAVFSLAGVAVSLLLIARGTAVTALTLSGSQGFGQRPQVFAN